MKIKHHEIQIPDDGTDPFFHCKLNRKQYAEILTDIVSSYADGFVLAINNPWGAGKTTFVKMWRQQLENEKFKTLYFNAWENDFEQDVLVALISELAEIKNKPVEIFNKVLDKAVSLTSKVVPAMAKHIARKAIGDEAAEAIIEGFTEYGAEELKEQIKSYSSRKKSIEDFKDNLEVFVNAINKDKPLIFIIDELDRCRPNYAVEVLEQIKHLFSVPGIVFVLSIDKIQLGHAVRGVYGSELIAADEYLRRFIDLEYSIPEPNKRLMVNYLYDYFLFEQFFQNNQRSPQFHSDDANFKNFATAIVRGSNFSLRKIEKLFSSARVALTTVSLTEFVYPDLFLLLIYLRIENETVFKGILDRNYTVQELIDLIEKMFGTDKQEDNILFISVIVGLALSYHNYYYQNKYPFVQFDVLKDEKGDIIDLNYKSKFVDVQKNKNLLNAFFSLRNRVNVDDFNIRPILDRILLLQPISN